MHKSRANRRDNRTCHVDPTVDIANCNLQYHFLVDNSHNKNPTLGHNSTKEWWNNISL